MLNPLRHVESDAGPFHVAANLHTHFVRAPVSAHHLFARRLSTNRIWHSAARRIEYFFTHSEPSRRASSARASSRTSRIDPRLPAILPNTYGPRSSGSKPQTSPFSTQVVPQARASARAMPKLSLGEAVTKNRARFKRAAISTGERQFSTSGRPSSIVDHTLT